LAVIICAIVQSYIWCDSVNAQIGADFENDKFAIELSDPLSTGRERIFIPDVPHEISQSECILDHLERVLVQRAVLVGRGLCDHYGLFRPDDSTCGPLFVPLEQREWLAGRHLESPNSLSPLQSATAPTRRSAQQGKVMRLPVTWEMRLRHAALWQARGAARAEVVRQLKAQGVKVSLMSAGAITQLTIDYLRANAAELLAQAEAFGVAQRLRAELRPEADFK
jgi:hypothetical protein